MFEAATFKYASQLNNTVGELLEALLYYNRIHVFFNVFEVAEIIKHIGLQNFDKIVKIPHLTVTILPEFTGASTNNYGIFSVHGGVIGRIAKTADGKKVKLKEHAVSSIASGAGIRVGRTLENLLLRKCRISTYDKIISTSEDINKLIVDTTNNKSVFEVFARHRAFQVGATFSESDFANVNLVSYFDSGRIVTLPADFSKFIVGGNQQDVTWGHLLSDIHSYWLENFFAASVRNDLISNPFYMKVANKTVNDVIVNAIKAPQEIVKFQNSVFENGRYFAEAVDTGEISIDEAIKIIMKNEKLRNWVGNMPPGTEIMQEYCSKLLEGEGALSRTGKTLTRTGFAAIGALIDGGFITGLLSNLTLDSAQNFFLDKIIKRWSPTIFVKGMKKRLG